MKHEYSSAEVKIEQEENKAVVEIQAEGKIIRLVALGGYIEIVERHEFGEFSCEGSSQESSEPENVEKKKRGRRRRKREGKKKAGKCVRILRIFKNTLFKYPNGYRVKVEGRRGAPSLVAQSLAISWVRDVIRKLESGTDDDIEVFEGEIKENLDSFDPVMKDLLKELLESWRKYKARSGDEGDEDGEMSNLREED